MSDLSPGNDAIRNQVRMLGEGHFSLNLTPLRGGSFCCLESASSRPLSTLSNLRGEELPQARRGEVKSIISF